MEDHPLIKVEDSQVLTAEQEKKVQEILGEINVQDNYGILQYGIEAQKNISSFADQILTEVRAKDAGYVGEILGSLMMKIKDLNVEGLTQQKRGFFSKIPFFGSLVDEVEKFVAKYQRLSTEIETILKELENAKDQLLRDIIMFDHLYARNLEYFQQLEIYIRAGQLKLVDLKENVLPQLKEKAEASMDSFEAQRYHDMNQLVGRFEKKVHDLQLSRTIALQTAPQIRMIQGNNQVLVEKIQSSIMNTIPLWKNQMVIAIGLFRQGKALEVQREINETTNELLLKNSAFLKQNTTNVARESEKGVVEVETLKTVQEDLLHTIEEVLQIQEEGRHKRRAVELELEHMEKELKNKLTRSC